MEELDSDAAVYIDRAYTPRQLEKMVEYCTETFPTVRLVGVSAPSTAKSESNPFSVATLL